MTRVRQPFKSRSWKIFLLQENAHDVALKKKKKKIPGGKSKAAETITGVDSWVKRGLPKGRLSKISKRWEKRDKDPADSKCTDLTGNMGLYDGFFGYKEESSTAHGMGKIPKTLLFNSFLPKSDSLQLLAK